jgi:hypothetical protein
MFYNYFKNLFDQAGSIKKIFIRNIILSWMFCFFSLASINLKPDKPSSSVFFDVTLFSTILNFLFIYIVSRARRAKIYYLLIGLGGLSGLIVLHVTIFNLMGWKYSFLFYYLTIFCISLLTTIWLNYKTFDDKLIINNIKKKKSTSLWNIEIDIHSDSNKKYNLVVNLTRNFIAPFAPLFGVFVARNFDGEQEWIIIGFIILFLVIIMSGGYLKFLALGIKIFDLEKKTNSEVYLDLQ